MEIGLTFLFGIVSGFFLTEYKHKLDMTKDNKIFYRCKLENLITDIFNYRRALVLHESNCANKSNDTNVSVESIHSYYSTVEMRCTLYFDNLNENVLNLLNSGNAWQKNMQLYLDDDTDINVINSKSRTLSDNFLISVNEFVTASKIKYKNYF